VGKPARPNLTNVSFYFEDFKMQRDNFWTNLLALAAIAVMAIPLMVWFVSLI
jgi:hypothetical protein